MAKLRLNERDQITIKREYTLYHNKIKASLIELANKSFEGMKIDWINDETYIAYNKSQWLASVMLLINQIQGEMAKRGIITPNTGETSVKSFFEKDEIDKSSEIKKFFESSFKIEGSIDHLKKPEDNNI